MVLDHLAVLTSALAARGTPYTPVVVSTTDDFEVTRRAAGRRPISASPTATCSSWDDRLCRVTDPRAAHYAAVRVVPSWPARSTRPAAGRRSTTGSTAGTTVRVFDTHLEVSGPRAGRIQERQADELLGMVAVEPVPRRRGGRLQLRSRRPYTDTYERLTAVLHERGRRPGRPTPGRRAARSGCTRTAAPGSTGRMDLVLTSGEWPVTGVARTGAVPFRRVGPCGPPTTRPHARITVPG